MRLGCANAISLDNVTECFLQPCRVSSLKEITESRGNNYPGLGAILQSNAKESPKKCKFLRKLKIHIDTM